MSDKEQGDRRSWMEFHDSTFVSLHCNGADAKLIVNAYVHRWQVRHGLRRGTGDAAAARSLGDNSVTYHFFACDSHQCAQCEAFFLPFEQDLPCPRCGAPATEFYDFLTDAITGLTIHKRQYGRFSPDAFLVGGLAEHVFLLLCNALDAIDGAVDFQNAMRRHLDGCQWGDQAYLSSHVYDIALRIDKELRGRTAAGP